MEKQIIEPPSIKPWKGHLEGEQPYLGHLLAMVINHLLTGCASCPY